MSSSKFTVLDYIILNARNKEKEEVAARPDPLVTKVYKAENRIIVQTNLSVEKINELEAVKAARRSTWEKQVQRQRDWEADRLLMKALNHRAARRRSGNKIKGL